MTDFEQIRESFLPDKVRFLFVAQSPPSKDDGFFYQGCAMTGFTQDAFELAYRVRFHHQREFLRYFQSCGCYLEDLSHTKGESNKRTLMECAPFLADRIKELSPEKIIIALKGIKKPVEVAIKLSGRNDVPFVLPFAGNGWQNQYIAQLVEILREIMPVPPKRG